MTGPQLQAQQRDQPFPAQQKRGALRASAPCFVPGAGSLPQASRGSTSAPSNRSSAAPRDVASTAAPAAAAGLGRRDTGCSGGAAADGPGAATAACGSCSNGGALQLDPGHGADVAAGVALGAAGAVTPSQCDAGRAVEQGERESTKQHGEELQGVFSCGWAE